MSGLRKLRSTMLPRERNLTADEITSTSEVFLGTISELLEKDLSTATHGTGVSPDNVAQELEYFQECLLEAGDYFRPLQEQPVTGKRYNIGSHATSSAKTFRTTSRADIQEAGLLGEVTDISGDVYRGLETLTVIGSSVSLTAIGLTLIILIWLRYFSDRLLIMINLMIALGLAQTIFLTGVNATYNKVLCRTVAVLLHYLYMCVFSLMLAEGIQLFQKLYNAMSDGLRVGHLLIAAWTVPAIPVAISVAIRTEDYGTKSSCWLSMKHGTIWAFVGPALLVIFINTVILGLVLKVYLTVRINAKKTQLAKIRSSIKAAVVLLPLIGLTWLFGVMTISSSTVVFQYFFALLNSLQGFFIFIFHVALNNDVKESLKKKKEKLSRSRAWFSSSGSTSKVYFAKQNAVTPILVSSADGNPATTSAHA
ncbi:adhesion G-protein coupled receptor D1-like [Liolophura sinensis]|uniref:adhesion G-protein coupled receptor D1-like n=1 Tax=Liolophura sinensis TaxID=3198878 RepID=UPI0031588297